MVMAPIEGGDGFNKGVMVAPIEGDGGSNRG